MLVPTLTQLGLFAARVGTAHNVGGGGESLGMGAQCSWRLLRDPLCSVCWQKCWRGANIREATVRRLLFVVFALAAISHCLCLSGPWHLRSCKRCSGAVCICILHQQHLGAPTSGILPTTSIAAFSTLQRFVLTDIHEVQMNGPCRRPREIQLTPRPFSPDCQVKPGGGRLLQSGPSI